MAAAARTLRARLGDHHGARRPAPVYVVFTADTLPHFADYVRNFSRDEVHAVVGTTFPLTDAGRRGAEHVFKLVDRSFQRLFNSLA
jgi:type VI protein secretion system component VasK